MDSSEINCFVLLSILAKFTCNLIHLVVCVAWDHILRDFINASFYIHCLFHMVDLRMFSLSFLSYCTMDHDLPSFRFAHAVHSDVTLTLVFFNNCRLIYVNLI